MSVICQSKRLIFRLWELNDIEAFMSLCCDPGITEFASATYQNLTKSKAREFIKKELRRFQETKSAKFAVYLRQTGELIGIAGIFKMDEPFAKDFEINYRLRKNQWGKGLGSEAAQTMINYGFDQLRLEQVFASVAVSNLRSQRLLQRVGMSFDRDSAESGSFEQIWSISLKSCNKARSQLLRW